MKKNLLTMVMASACLMGLVACGGGASSAASSAPEVKPSTAAPAEDPLDKVLAAEDIAGFVVHGEHMVGDVVNGWDGKDPEVYKKTAMTAASINQIKAKNAALGEKLAAKKDDIKYLYYLDNVIFGTNKGSFSAKYYDGTKVAQRNSSFVVKAAAYSYIEEDNVYTTTQWIPDPHTARAEALTDNLFMPAWQEAGDANGFTWSDNPVVTGKAGKYTVVLAQYKGASSAEAAGYGMGLIFVEEMEEYVPPVITEHTYGLVGSVIGWDDGGFAMTKEAENVYSATREFVVDEQFKIKTDADWANPSYGFEAVDAANSDAVFANDGGNIKITTAGNYKVTLDLTGEAAKVTIKTAAAA